METRNVEFTITNFRIFDSNKLKGATFTGEGTVKKYEFEFYHEDCSGGHYLDGVYYPIKKDSCFFAKPGQRLRTDFPYKCVFLDITTDDPVLKEMLDSLPNYFPFLDVDEVVSLCRRMMTLNAQDELTAQLNRQGYANRILSLISRYHSSGLFNHSLSFRHQRRLLMLENYIKTHLSEDLSLKELARVCNLDPTYLHKLYTKAFGMTPANRVLMHRINAAKRGLLTQDLSMDALITRCGFSSQAYFCYCFKKATGKTPTQYQNGELGTDDRFHAVEIEENLL